MRITLKHIAEETGLSIATVSRALSRKKRNYSMSEKKIFSSARKLGYPLFFNPDNNNHLSIALVIELFEGEFYTSLLNGFYKASENSESEINLIVKPQNENIVDDIIALRSKHSGICLFYPSMKKDNYIKIKEGLGKFPLLSLIPSKNPRIDTVCFDSYSGGYMVAKHFEEQGYKNFGYISGPNNSADALFRKNGFLDHINEKNNLELVWSYDGDFTLSSGVSAFSDFKKSSKKNIAIFGSNDYSCFGFMKAAHESGYKIPDDFIISGFDDLSFCQNFTPELTSISTNFLELGKKSIKTIENMVSQDLDSIGEVSMIPVDIQIRKSSSPNF